MSTKVVLLRFNPPLIPNGQIVGYKVDIYLSDPTYAEAWNSDVFDENKNELLVGKLLKSNFTYWFTVAAKTSAGYGPSSHPMSAKTLDQDCK